jgi:aldose 1-epimerase
MDGDVFTFTRAQGQVLYHLSLVAHLTWLPTTSLLLTPHNEYTSKQAIMAADKQFSDSFTFLPQGGIIQEFKVAGTNVVLGFPSAESYRTKHNPFFGENIGRVANRISGAKINSLNGKSYDLAVNNGPNTLHGGAVGWGKKDFEGPTPVNRNGKESVMFKYLSKDGEEGFPGTVEMRLWYMPSIETIDGVEKTSLEIEYEAELVGDEVEETVIALTNHRYAVALDNPSIIWLTIPSQLLQHLRRPYDRRHTRDSPQ